MTLLALIEGEAEAVLPLAARLGLTLAELRMRLNTGRPALLDRVEPASAPALVSALAAGGARGLALEEAIPGPAARGVVRSFTLGPAAVRFELAPTGARELPYADLALLLRGMRVRRTATTQLESRKEFSPGKALLTQGLVTTSTVKREVRKEEESAEMVVLAYDRSGGALELAEAKLSYAGLAPPLEPSRAANLQRLVRELRARAPQAAYDERLLQLGRRPLPFPLPGEPDPFDVYAEVLHRALVG